MRKFGRSAILGFVAAAFAVGGLATPATADISRAGSGNANGSESTQITTHARGDGTAPPAELGNPVEWGKVTVEMDASAGDISPLAENCVEPSSGGTWCFGWYTTTVNGEPRKRCYSNYYHYTKKHSATTKMAGSTSKDIAAAGSTAQSGLTAGFAYTCEAFYATY